jgi:hypothetical protein
MIVYMKDGCAKVVAVMTRVYEHAVDPMPLTKRASHVAKELRDGEAMLTYVIGGRCWSKGRGYINASLRCLLLAVARGPHGTGLRCSSSGGRSWRGLSI